MIKNFLFLDYLIDYKANLKKVMIKMEQKGLKSMIVVKKKKLFGVATDGDIRRFILKNNNLEIKISQVCNLSPIKILEKQPTSKIKGMMEQYKINIIPLVDKKNFIKDVFYFENLNKNNLDLNKYLSVVIMAGGKGIRMKPFTNVFPKALLPFKKSTAIEEIIKILISQNLKDIFITVGFKANILINYLKNHIKNVKIRFASERIPLGTLGGIKKLQKKIKNNFIVINCDTLLEISFLDLYSSHLNTNNLITIVAANHDLKINYGTFDLSRKGEVLDIIEKPEAKYLLNTGCYIVNKSALRYVPKNKYFNLTDLIKILVKKKKKIGLFNISKKQWNDIGNWKDYEESVST
jgi:dTDP-glucose pyrophosphorylase